MTEWSSPDQALRFVETYASPILRLCGGHRPEAARPIQKTTGGTVGGAVWAGLCLAGYGLAWDQLLHVVDGLALFPRS